MADFPSAGNAQERSGNVENPVGLYRHPDGFEIGVTDPAQGDAVIRQGFSLVETGRDAAMKAGSSKEAKKAEGRESLPQSQQPTSTGQAMDASDTGQDALDRVPNRNIVAPVERGNSSDPNADLSKEEQKRAEDAKEELSGEHTSAVEQLETALDTDLGAGTKKSKKESK